MAVSKRTRYEVLRRDNHTCRYCGASAPETALHIDHVLPVALGGSDDPTNLVAACPDCNVGKAASTPDATLVANVSQDAFRYAAAAAEANRQFLARQEDAERYEQYCIDSWVADFGWPEEGEGWDFDQTFRIWQRRGVPVQAIDEGIRITRDKDHLRPDRQWKYFCGVVWNIVRELDAETRRLYQGGQ